MNSCDKDIIAYIIQHPDNDFDAVIKNDARWPVFYHLSELRQSILNWYTFKAGASLLEVGGGMGALTGLFCERCANVITVEKSEPRAEAIRARYRGRQNLSVITGDVSELAPDRRFDYITAIGIMDSQPDTCAFLTKLKSLLKPDGCLLLASENRFGLKYWCGAPEKHSQLPFAGINNVSTAGRHYGKAALKRLLRQSGFPNSKFYYPLPDYILPQAIYSETLTPGHEASEMLGRLIFYYPDNSTHIAAEKALYAEIIENGAFEFFANSFLAECAAADALCPINHVVLSTDRPTHRRFATAIYEGGCVKKTPLHPSGRCSVQALDQNLSELNLRGIRTVEHRLENNSLVMPEHKSETLWVYIRNIGTGHAARVFELTDRLYEQILSSSEHIGTHENYFYEKYPSLDFGPILRKAYIEMIYLNCFFENNEFIFFDQEFTRERFPAKYVLYRSLCYSPLRGALEPSVEDMKRRYGMSEVWDIFAGEERRFFRDLRNLELYQNFYGWSAPSAGSMKRNALMLSQRRLVSWATAQGIHNIAVYGYAEAGSLLCDTIENAGINVAYAIDRRAESMSGGKRPVILPDAPMPPVDAVIITVTRDVEQVAEELARRAECPIVSLSDIWRD